VVCRNRLDAAFALALAALLYQVKPDDPETYVAIAAILGTIALLASYLPTRPATWVEPSQALRSE
jgi:putative ABC transport system permease protein